MKKILFILMLLSSLLLHAQKIEKDIIDEFTKQRTIYTSWVKVDKGSMKFRFISIDNSVCLEYRYQSNHVIAIDKGAELLFLESYNNDVHKLTNIEYAIASIGGGATGFAGSNGLGIRTKYVGDISFFKNNLKKMRIYTTDGYIDKEISADEAINLQKLYKIFTKTLSIDCTNKK